MAVREQAPGQREAPDPSTDDENVYVRSPMIVVLLPLYYEYCHRMAPCRH